MTSLVFSLFSILAMGCSDDDAKNIEFDAGDFVVSKTDMALAGTAEQSLTIKSPVKPAVSSDAAWLHVGTVEKGNASTLYTVSVWADENTSFDVRKATVTVTAGALTKSVTVSQYGAETVEIKNLNPGAELAAEGGVLSVTYAATGTVSIKAPEWLKEVKSKALTENVVNFSYSAHYGDAERAGEIVISLASDASITASVAVNQANMVPSTDMSDDAKTLAKKMFAGVNIGNTMECPGKEGAWSGSKVTEEYIKGLKALGFNAVRVPCAWDSYISDAATNTIDPTWLSRVDEVVGWIVANDMYAILNIHWDGGWLENSCKEGYSEAVNKKQQDYWTQIAKKLNHYDQHLLFAGMNEPNYENNKSIDAIMAYQQTFVDAVRATGGNNAMRVLVHQAPNTDINASVANYYHLPTDVVKDRAMVEVHFYDPSDYTIMGSDGEWGAGSLVKLYWGKNFHVEGSNRNCTWGEESHVDGQFKKMNDKYVSAGVPVILGEYSSSVRNTTAFPELDKSVYEPSRAYWNEYVTKAAKSNGCVPFYWETGGDISRKSGNAINPYAIDGLMKGANAATYPF
jgi:aryl-phospho-beta-D-glucosidase BglC (GH1 family)